jgi:GNAT superfamily N-acetyltransferase
MVKAKQLKQLRKTIEKADRMDKDLLDEDMISLQDGKMLSIEYCFSNKVSSSVHKRILELFEANMGEMYAQSSWGLDLNVKAEEVQHKKSRFLLTTCDDESKILTSYVCFRFEYDYEEDPSCCVLYVYEVQVDEAFQSKGIGNHLMLMLESIGKKANMYKVMLTVFTKNASALKFYKQRGYIVDASSPSGPEIDYEILSKLLL